MARSAALKASLDDALQSVRIERFDGGLNTESDPNDLGLADTPDAQNVKITQDGRLTGRDGYTVRIGSLAAAADGIGFFYDSNGDRVVPLWADGNLYNVVTGSAVLIAAAIYTAGERIALTYLNNVVYYSDGIAALRRWNPATGVEQAVPNAGGGGVIAPPAAKVLATYNGAIIAGNNIAAGSPEPHAVRWSNTNDPTTWVGTNVFQVGQGQGGEVNCIIPFGISASGVSPFKALFVGKSQFGCFALKGALSSLEEVILNIPAGVRDGATARYVPATSGGFIAFLGTDFRVWGTDGIQGVELSEKIRAELRQYVLDRIKSQGSAVKFTSAMNTVDNQYVLDVGGTRQYTFDWTKRGWMRYGGWPSGYWVEAVDTEGKPMLLCADHAAARLLWVNIGISDNGLAINPYYKVAWIHGGSPNIFKIWKFLTLEYMTDSSDMVLTAQTKDGVGDQCVVTIPAVTPSAAATARWGISLWGTAVWAASGAIDFPPYKKRVRIAYTADGVTSPSSMRGSNIQVKISQTVSGAHFELLSLELEYLPRGRKRDDIE